ncbi:hypothetical protein [Streptosporangium sp. NPDC000509]|uniref:hypothetical protein n=1 Tax=Streptosporangium sp. NPDC000509 TaxID=3366186 RepID=UPI00367E1730
MVDFTVIWIDAEADRAVAEVVGRGRFEVVSEPAEHLPMTVVPDPTGLPDHGRTSMMMVVRSCNEDRRPGG